MKTQDRFSVLFIFLLYVPVFLAVLMLLLISVKLKLMREDSAIAYLMIFLAIVAAAFPLIFVYIKKLFSKKRA